MLSFPATSAGVERLFNTAQDICHYRQGRMKSQMIQDLMMFHCTSRFDLEEQEAKLLEKFFSHEEIETAKEEKEEKIDKVKVEPISDTEEHRDGIVDELELDEDDEACLVVTEDQTRSELPLPGNSTQVRPVQSSGRKRKSRDDDLFEYH